MLAAFAYILWHMAMKRAPLGSRATPVDAYLLLFIAVGFFLMCAVSPNTHIAVAGYRAVVEYLFWFFLVTRLIENDRDFAVFYGALVVMALCIAAHGIYQYIVAAPIPSSWVSQTEASVRTHCVLAHRAARISWAVCWCCLPRWWQDLHITAVKCGSRCWLSARPA